MDSSSAGVANWFAPEEASLGGAEGLPCFGHGRIGDLISPELVSSCKGDDVAAAVLVAAGVAGGGMLEVGAGAGCSCSSTTGAGAAAGLAKIWMALLSYVISDATGETCSVCSCVT